MIVYFHFYLMFIARYFPINCLKGLSRQKGTVMNNEISSYIPQPLKAWPGKQHDPLISDSGISDSGILDSRVRLFYYLEVNMFKGDSILSVYLHSSPNPVLLQPSTFSVLSTVVCLLIN
uniref:Uncharacterized protein n=1 Tax=Sphaerodactylus townsendi TaxID=933632 RepID=A0ACB8GAN7_9SAUR